MRFLLILLFVISCTKKEEHKCPEKEVEYIYTGEIGFKKDKCYPRKIDYKTDFQTLIKLKTLPNPNNQRNPYNGLYFTINMHCDMYNKSKCVLSQEEFNISYDSLFTNFIDKGVTCPKTVEEFKALKLQNNP
jgi:hypothetical protein